MYLPAALCCTWQRCVQNDCYCGEPWKLPRDEVIQSVIVLIVVSEIAGFIELLRCTLLS